MAVDIHRPTAHDFLSLEEFALYHRIMDYRAGLGLPAIPLSAALTATAGRHVLDTRENIWGAGKEPPAGANYHSWSDAPYRADHRDPQVMWSAPQRLGTGYDAPGYEITGVGYAGGATVLAGWRASPSHDAILTGRGAWAGTEFHAIGIGAETSSGAGRFAGRVHHVWFGELPDVAPTIRGTGGSDKIRGTAFADRIDGRAGSDAIAGGAGNDVLVGGTGRDRISGGPGVDRLYGGPGADVLTGGPGADLFVFSRPSDAGRGRSRDRITDFEPGRDRIDLRGIDARPDLDGDQPFAFIGGSALRGPGTLRAGAGIVAGDIDGDGRSDFQIAVAGGHVLTADDFLL